MPWWLKIRLHHTLFNGQSRALSGPQVASTDIMHLWYALQTAAMALGTLNGVASFPLHEAISPRGILPKSTIAWAGSQDGKCIVGEQHCNNNVYLLRKICT